jgi:AcrR family transcriptional regulator
MTGALPADLWPDVRSESARTLMFAALNSFAQRGFHATTTRDIATEAGMSPAALYVHFPSKAAVLFAISRSAHEQALALTRESAARTEAPAERMRAFVEDFVAWHARHHTLARVAQYELRALPADQYRTIADLRRGIERGVRAIITDGVATGAFRVPDVKTTARAVLSLGIDVARWYGERARISPVALSREYSELVLRMLGG